MIGRNVRKIFICIAAALSATPVLAQHYIGVRGGWGGGMGRIEPKPDEKGTVWGLTHGGISWKYYSKERYVGGVQADLMFMQYGFRSYDFANLPDGSNERAERIFYYQRTINTITLPVYWQTSAYLFARQMRVFLNLGVSLSYNYSSDFEEYNYITERKVSGDYDMILSRDNPLMYGLTGGVGAGWSFDRLEVLFETRYYFGYGDVYRNRNRYELNPIRSPLDNIQFSLGVYWRLGKGGILSPPTPKVAAKMREMEEARKEKEMENNLKNPQKQIREWDREFEETMREESLRLDKEIKTSAAEIAHNARQLTSSYLKETSLRLPLEGISPAVSGQ